MPEQNDELNCECCESSVAGMEVHSSETFAVICENCFEDDFYCCDECNGTHYEPSDSPSEGIHGELFCSECTNDNHRCISCENVLIPRIHDYYEDPNDYHYCCSGCADSYAFSDCQECGTELYYDSVHEECAQEGYCYDCYNKQNCGIENHVTNSVKIEKIALSKHYKSGNEPVMDFFRHFYGYTGDSFEHNRIMLPKSGGGYGNGFGYHNTYLKIASISIKKMKEYIYNMIKSKMFVQDHRKLGLYNPMHQLFGDCFKYYDNKTGDYFTGDELDDKFVGQNWSRYSISAVDSRMIYEKLKVDIQDGGMLRQKIIKSLSGSARHRLSAIFDEHHSFWNDFEQYKTNTAVTKLPIKIGFDPADLNAIKQHNCRVSSCQVESNNESYAFSMIDLVVNPHLVALIYDEKGKSIIGRSVVRLFKQKGDETNKTFIAPSRLYLSDLTHAKSELYNELFVAVDKWGKKNFEDGSQLIAGTESLHDTPPAQMLSPSRFIQKPTSDNNDARLYTQWWHTWFREKPDNDEAKFVYYQDEGMQTDIARIPDYDKFHEEYALRETLRYRQYTQLEVKDENEQ